MTDKDDQILASFGYSPQLKRSLNLYHLIAFGVNYMMPLAPAIIFGLLSSVSGTTVALPYLIAFIAMLFTANAYVFMIKRFPLAGSLYAYVKQCTSEPLGFIAGWIILLDYILIPTTASVSATLYLQDFFPNVSYHILLFIFIWLAGIINFFQIKIMANTGLYLLIISEIILFTAFFVWGRYIVKNEGGYTALFSMYPLQFTNISSLLSATSIAVLSYLGFDAITTLSEEVENPSRNIALAIFISICIGAITMFLFGYLGILTLPNLQDFIQNIHWKDTALFFINEQTGGLSLSIIFTTGFIISMFVFNIVAIVATSRLLFGMGRDNVLPKQIFTRISHRFKTPYLNILIILIIESLIGFFVSLETISELVNFGALCGFFLLNCSMTSYLYKHPQIANRTIHYSMSIIGAIILATIIAFINKKSLITGISWLTIGMIYYMIIRKKGILT